MHSQIPTKEAQFQVSQSEQIEDLLVIFPFYPFPWYKKYTFLYNLKWYNILCDFSFHVILVCIWFEFFIWLLLESTHLTCKMYLRLQDAIFGSIWQIWNLFHLCYLIDLTCICLFVCICQSSCQNFKKYLIFHEMKFWNTFWFVIQFFVIVSQFEWNFIYLTLIKDHKYIHKSDFPWNEFYSNPCICFNILFISVFV